MLKMLIVENNIYQCQKIANIISSNIEDVKLYSYVYTGKQALEIIATKCVDFILLDLKLPDISSLDIIEYLATHNIYQYKKSIIVVSSEFDMISQIIYSDYIFDVISKPVNYNKLIRCVYNIINEKQDKYKLNTLMEKIISELVSLNYNISHNGTLYLAEAILQSYLVRRKHD